MTRKAIREVEELTEWIRWLRGIGATSLELHRRGTRGAVEIWDLGGMPYASKFARAICARADRLPQGDRGVLCDVFACDGYRMAGIELRERRDGKPVGEPGEGLVWKGMGKPRALIRD